MDYVLACGLVRNYAPAHLRVFTAANSAPSEPASKRWKSF